MADRININPSVDREHYVTTQDGETGASGVVWVIVALLLLVVAYFVFATNRSTTNDGTDVNITPNPGTTEQNNTTENENTNPETTVPETTEPAPSPTP